MLGWNLTMIHCADAAYLAIGNFRDR